MAGIRKSMKLTDVIKYAILVGLALLSVLPFVHIAMVSLSEKSAIASGRVSLWPIGYNWEAYRHIFNLQEFRRALVVTLQRTVLGGAINFLLTVLAAYPLSKTTKAFKWRTLYVWLFFITTLFNGGLIPWYFVIRQLGLIDSLWALVLPGAVPVFHLVLLLNFFRQIPNELEEAAFMDGADHWTILWKVFVPISLPALATVTLFSLIGHWNNWFDGLILMNRTENYPLQSYLKTVLESRDYTKFNMTDWRNQSAISEEAVKSGMILCAALPIILVYPFLQKYFTKGIILGSVKG